MFSLGGINYNAVAAHRASYLRFIKMPSIKTSSELQRIFDVIHSADIKLLEFQIERKMKKIFSRAPRLNLPTLPSKLLSLKIYWTKIKQAYQVENHI